MELNASGLIKAESVKDVKRIHLKTRDGETVRHRLARARTRLQIGEIAVFYDREWLRVRSAEHHGAGWLEIAASADSAPPADSGAPTVERSGNALV